MALVQGMTKSLFGSHLGSARNHCHLAMDGGYFSFGNHKIAASECFKHYSKGEKRIGLVPYLDPKKLAKLYFDIDDVADLEWCKIRDTIDEAVKNSFIAEPHQFEMLTTKNQVKNKYHIIYPQIICTSKDRRSFWKGMLLCVFL